VCSSDLQATAAADNPDEVNPDDFTYPGPVPQSKETAVMMLADGCESTVRARRPSSKQEIFEIVQGIIAARNKAGQLDESGLTSNDIKTIRSVFVDMLQAVFHPRINYPSGLTPTPKAIPVEVVPDKKASRESRRAAANATAERASAPTDTQTVAVPDDEEEDVAPLPDVPPLPRRTEPKPTDEKNDNTE